MASSSARGRPRDADIDAAVLAAAQQSLAAVGYEAMSVSAVAVAAGTTRQALYRRWPSKADLATAAVAAMSEMGSRPDSEDPLDDLRAELEAFRSGVTRRNGVSMVGTMLQESVDPELRDLFRARLVGPRRRRLRRILERGVEAGLLSEDADLDIAVASCTGALYSTVLAGDRLPARWAERTADLVWRGCGGTTPIRTTG